MHGCIAAIVPSSVTYSFKYLLIRPKAFVARTFSTAACACSAWHLTAPNYALHSETNMKAGVLPSFYLFGHFITVLLSVSTSSWNDHEKFLFRRDSLPQGNTTNCQIYPVTQESWNKLQVEQFISSFPRGKDMPLEDFIFANNVTNFACGLGENCLAGQVNILELSLSYVFSTQISDHDLEQQCLPFQGPLWFILYALQEWNIYVNSFDEATTAAVTQVRGIPKKIALMLPSFLFIPLVCDWLFSLISPDLHEHQVHALATLLVTVAGIGILSLGVGLLGPVLFPTWGAVATAELTEVGGAEVLPAVEPLSPTLRKRHLATPDEKLPDVDTIFQSDATLRSQLMKLSAPQRGASQTGNLGVTLEQLQKLQKFLLYDSAWAAFLRYVLTGDEKNVNKIKEQVSRDQPKPFEGEANILKKRSSPQSVPRDRFYAWTIINSHLSSFCDHLRAIIAITAKIGVSAPVSSDEGVKGILEGGKLIIPNPSLSQLQDQIREAMRLSALAQVLKSMDKCNGKGLNGAREGKDRLSYCSPEGLMMNLIRASGKKSVNKIVNAHLITEKYGYTVEFLAQSAWSCQEHNLKIEGRPVPIGLRSDSKMGCTFDLPVCDTRIPEVANLRRQGKTVVIACRRGLALNI
ncbi:hypothetical protein O181_020639 [Austropuccinia psidii MF-1]|uniref:DUF7872 domain-containing protein n=1 Tax=Austropuccinia psidii MF-1 TaxID=1389203 RepID=A0A9Q3GVW8_9BASI|nr:hypothetical protein [Austropuccinia psidii MF-1]